MKILVEVGSHKMPFDRLLREIDSLAGRNKWDVFAQTGYSNYKMENSESKDFISMKELEKKTKWADIIVAHGGAGNIITVLNTGKPLVLVPRRKKFLEHTDDHQTELAGVLEKEGKCIMVNDIKLLEQAIDKVKKPVKGKTNKDQTIERIDTFLKKMERVK